MKIFKIISVILGVGLLSVGYAESEVTCPSVATIKQNKAVWPNGPWLPLYVSNEELAMPADIDKFRQSIIGFDHAEWNKHFSEAGHCFYQGSDKIILAQDMLKPNKADTLHWQFMDAGLA